MKNFINFLPPWVETNLQPAFYDKESGACLQQTARMYAKVNQLVRIANEQYAKIEEFIAKFIELKDYVEDYFENLDVQEEINNKLDEMAEDGTLTDILNNKILPTIEAFEEEVNDDIADLRAELSTIASASPIPVASTSDMTDHNRIYVNTTDGNWYYWSSSNNTWTNGGTYQATGISNGSVAGNALYDGTPTPKYTYTQNYFYGVNGAKTYNTNWELCEEYFPCQSGDSVSITNVRAAAITLWDSNKEFLLTVDVGNNLTNYTHTFVNASMAYITVAFPKGYTHQLTINNKEVLNKWNVEWLKVTSDNLDFTPSGLSGSNLKDDSVYRGKLILDNGESVTKGSYWTHQGSEPYIVPNANWSRFTNLYDVEEGDIIQAKNVRSSWLVKFDENGQPLGYEQVTGITNATYTVGAAVHKVGFNLANDVIANAELYINNEQIIFDNGSRATIDWLKLNDEQKASIGGYDISRFADYNTLFIGDSITEKNFRASTNWVDYITSELQITNYLNGGMSGTGILHSFGTSPNWIDKLPTYSNDYDMILVMGDMNDWSNKEFTADNLGQYGDNTTATFYGAMKVYLEMLLTKYPLGKIGWIISTPRNQQITGTSDYLHGKSSVFAQGVEIIKEMCANYSIPVLDLYDESSLYPWITANNNYYFKPDEGAYSADAIHPNSKAQRIMAYKIKDFIVRNF